jgi:hypothetical protein
LKPGAPMISAEQTSLLALSARSRQCGSSPLREEEPTSPDVTQNMAAIRICPFYVDPFEF